MLVYGRDYGLYVCGGGGGSFAPHAILEIGNGGKVAYGTFVSKHNDAIRATFGHPGGKDPHVRLALEENWTRFVLLYFMFNLQINKI